MTDTRRVGSPESRQRTALTPAPAGAARPPAPRLRVLSREECEALLARNVVGRIAFAHRGHVNISPTNYVYAAGWLFARADDAMRMAIRRNRWVALEVAEVSGVSDWRSVVVRGACYATSASGSASDNAALESGVALLRREVPEMASSDKAVPFRTAIFRVHVDEMSGCEASSSPAPRELDSTAVGASRAGRGRTSRERGAPSDTADGVSRRVERRGGDEIDGERADDDGMTQSAAPRISSRASRRSGPQGRVSH
jgi:nitroimidazol reductase NimA-like FMN-containing flavoprotein (pyridoxamine 5'-phosphate oxidase superfamily)